MYKKKRANQHASDSNRQYLFCYYDPIARKHLKTLGDGSFDAILETSLLMPVELCFA